MYFAKRQPDQRAGSWISAGGFSLVELLVAISIFGIRVKVAVPRCTLRDIPQNATEWALVNQLFINVTARSRTKTSDGQYYRVSGKVSAKPRNLLPG